VTHHWHPSDGLSPSDHAGEWMLHDRSILIGSIEHGRVAGQHAFRAVTPHRALVGYAWTLEAACDRLWAWHVVVSGAA